MSGYISSTSSCAKRFDAPGIAIKLERKKAESRRKTAMPFSVQSGSKSPWGKMKRMLMRRWDVK